MPLSSMVRVVRQPISRSLRLASLVALMVLSASCDQWMTRPMRYEALSLTAKRRNGTPVPGVKVILYTGARAMGYETTDAKGTAAFPQVPFGSYGLYAYEFPAGYFVTGGYGNQYYDGIAVNGSPVDRFDFTIYKEGAGSILVRTVDASGAAIPNVSVRAFDQAGNTRATLSDSTGQVLLTMGTGTWNVNAENPGAFLNASLPKLVSKNAILVDEGYADTARLVLTPCAGSYRVRVLDIFGAPVPNFPVMLYMATGAVAIKPTGSDGTYTWTNQICGNYGLMLQSLPGYLYPVGQGKSYFDGLTIQPSSTVPQVTFTVTRVVP